MRARVVGIVVVAAAAVSTWGSRAYALDGDVTSDTAAQFYDVRSPTGETVLTRRRLTTTLGVGAYNILDQPTGDPDAPQLLFRARLRYDADYGSSGAEADSTNFGRYVPGFQQGPIDLMYGYVEGRKFLHGWLGFKVGRQYVTDSLGWYSFDGGEAKITTPYYFAVEGYGGLEVRGGMPLSTPRFQSDGVWRGDRSGVDPSLYPSFQPSDIAPVVGASIESAGVTWLHGRLTYRRVLNTGDSNTAEFASGLYTPTLYSGSRVSSERLGYSVDVALWDKASARGGLTYDLYIAKFATLYAGVDTFITKRLNVGVDYQFYQPTFDADSIWNFFMSEPMNDIGARAGYQVSDHVALSADGHVRIFTVQNSELETNASPNIQANNPSYFPSSPYSYDGSGGLSARYKSAEGSLGARTTGSWGAQGDRMGIDVTGERIVETRYVFQGRAGVWSWKDNLRPDRDATSFQYVAGVGYIFAPRCRTLVEFEDSMNGLVGQRFRLMLWLTLAVTK